MSTMPTRPRLGAGLESMIFSDPIDVASGIKVPAATKPGFMAPGSKGAMIAGIIGDTLASLSGGAPVFTQNMMAERQRKADLDAQEAQWSRRQQAEDDRWQRRQEFEINNRPPTEFERMLEASGVARGSPEWTAAMGKRVQRQLDEPEIMVPLPGGMYVGPRSGLAAALSSGAAPTAAPAAPVGKLRPMGGPTPGASGSFPY